MRPNPMSRKRNQTVRRSLNKPVPPRLLAKKKTKVHSPQEPPESPPEPNTSPTEPPESPSEPPKSPIKFNNNKSQRRKKAPPLPPRKSMNPLHETGDLRDLSDLSDSNDFIFYLKDLKTQISKINDIYPNRTRTLSLFKKDKMSKKDYINAIIFKIDQKIVELEK